LLIAGPAAAAVTIVATQSTNINVVRNGDDDQDCNRRGPCKPPKCKPSDGDSRDGDKRKCEKDDRDRGDRDR
jgi:hypothetical protein